MRISRAGMAVLMLACAAVLALLPAAAETAAPSAAPGYADLVARGRSGERDIDFLALRNAYAQDPGYDPYGMKIVTLVRDMNKPVVTSGAHAIDAESVLALNFIFIDAHFVTAACQEQAGHREAGRRAMMLARGLYASIVKSGDGKSPATAYQIVSLAEEYDVLRGLRLAKQRQARVNANGRAYDRIEAKVADSGATVVLWFNVDRILAARSRELQPRQQ